MSKLTSEERYRIRKLGGKGYLTQEDLKDFSQAKKRIYHYMSDGQWHRAEAIIVVSGQREGLRRLRELRDYVDIKVRRVGDGRSYQYRMVWK